jgi:hypothetical protein
MNRTALLTIDGILNLLLGILLIIYPDSAVDYLGVPSAMPAFYPNILGAVLLGIGLALLVERFGAAAHTRGLGLHGAVVINLCGGFMLAAWLLFGELALTTQGSVLLWLLVVLLVGLSAVEAIASFRKKPVGE